MARHNRTGLPCTAQHGSFTLQAWIFPTTPPRGAGHPDKWSAAESKGYGLFVDEGGELALWGSTQEEGRTDSYRQPLRVAEWLVAACMTCRPGASAFIKSRCESGRKMQPG
jgi:hypothetical protein